MHNLGGCRSSDG